MAMVMLVKTLKNKDLKDAMKEEKKLEMFYSRLKSRNSTEEWYDALTPAQTASWATVKAVFTVHWSKKVLQAQSGQDKGNRLKAHILKSSKLGSWKEDNRREELSHIIWANQTLTLTNDIPDPAGLLIPEVRHLLLEVHTT